MRNEKYIYVNLSRDKIHINLECPENKRKELISLVKTYVKKIKKILEENLALSKENLKLRGITMRIVIDGSIKCTFVLSD